MAERHNHFTRDIKPLGACPRCDDFRNSAVVWPLDRSWGSENGDPEQERGSSSND